MARFPRTRDPGEMDPDNLPEGGFGWMLIRSEVDKLEYRRDDERNVLVMGKSGYA